MSSQTYWRTAREFRMRAAGEADPGTRLCLLESALEYERLAEAADQLDEHFAFTLVPPAAPKTESARRQA